MRKNSGCAHILPSLTGSSWIVLYLYSASCAGLPVTFYLFVASGFQLLPSSCSNPGYLYFSSLLDLLPHALLLYSPYFLGPPLTLFLSASTEQSNLSLPLLLVSFPEPRHTKHIDQRVGSNHILLAAQETILNNSQTHTQIFRN